MPAGTFAVALGVSQGADHHLPTGQAVAGVKVAQATLGMDVLGLNDLGGERRGRRILQAWESPRPTPSLPLPHFFLLTSLFSFKRTQFPCGNVAGIQYGHLATRTASS